MTEETFTLDHPLVREAKARFERNHRQTNAKCKLSFEDLFRHFASGDYNFHALAREAGVWERAVRQYYERYFQQFFGEPKRRERQQVQTLARREELAQTEWVANPNLRPVGEHALSVGLSVKASLGTNGVHVDVLEIAGKVCQVHTTTCKWSPPPQRIRRYARFQVQTAETEAWDFHILRAAVPGFPERVLVVPSSALSSPSGNKQVFIPLEPRTSARGGHPKTQWRLYEDAWHLLTRDW